MISVHFDGALGAEVGFEDVLQTLGGVDVHVQSRRFVQHLRIRVQHSQRHRLLLLLLLVLELKPKWLQQRIVGAEGSNWLCESATVRAF